MKTLSTSEIASLVPGVERDNTYPIQLAIQAGEEVWRVIHNMQQVIPSRFGTNDDDDWTGWVWLAGKRTPVETAYWGDVLIWRLSDEIESEPAAGVTFADTDGNDPDAYDEAESEGE